ncbi:MAG: tyrosine-type recombinase/integrase [Pseudomonadota bacterium]
MDQLAGFGNIHELLARLESLSETREPTRQDAEAVLGAVEPPIYKVSEALEVYCQEIAVKDLLGKSAPQKKSWQKVKRRAVNNFISVVGDLPMTEITRDHGRKFYNWWAKRLQPNGERRALTPNSANRDLGNLRKLYREFWEYQGDEARENPFRKLNFGNHGLKDIPHFDDEWVRSKFLNPRIFQGLNPEATLLIYAMIETGCRPSELANLTSDKIHLDHKVPFVSIKPTSNRQLKSEASARDIPLVGVSLEAFKHAPDGFPHYRDRGTLLSASLMKAFRTSSLFPSKDHRIYSFRHSFEKRMLESGLDFGLRCLLMGHKNARPAYGDGGSLEYRRDQLLKIAHIVPEGFAERLPTLS